MSRQAFAWEQSYPGTLSWHTRIERCAVWDLLDAAAKEVPDAPALHFRDREISFSRWRDESGRFAAALLETGLAPDKAIAVLMPNTPYLPISFFAILRAGARVVLLSPLDSPRILAHKIADSGARTLITTNLEGVLASSLALLDAGGIDRMIVADDARFGRAGEAHENIPERDGVVELGKFLEGHSTSAAWPAIGVDEVALLQYTGGTTGLPKAAILTHGNLSAASSSYNAWFDAIQTEPDPVERVLCVLPLFHIYALSAVMLLCVRRRAEVILHTRFDAGAVLADIERLGITSFPGVPTMWIALTAHPEFTKRDLSSLRRYSSGGAPLPVEIARRVEKMTGERMVGGWGMSETAAAGTGLLPFGEPRYDSIGMPLPGVELQIVSLEEPTRPLPPGETGELRVRGLNITGGYWNRHEETAAAICDGYLLTGDIGYMAPDGHFYIVDRKSDLIISGGFNVYPQLVEQAIYEHPDVAECVVVGVPDSYRGESAKAFVVLRPEAGELALETLCGFLGGKLGRHEMPRSLEIREALPRTPVGKLSRKELRDEERVKASAVSAGN